jgi:nitroreductase
MEPPMPRHADSPEELSAEKVAQLLAAAQRRPQLADLPAYDDEAVFDGLPVLRRGASGVEVENDPRAFDPARRRIRDRYISVRFAGLARSASDLENPHRVIKAARLCYEEQQPEIALELLRLAIAQNATEPRLRLAELDLAWRMQDAQRFVAAARAFHQAFGARAEWAQVARLGRRLAPTERLFAGAPGGEGDDVAPPDWMHDEAAAGSPPLEAAAFHRAMLQQAPHGH